MNKILLTAVITALVMVALADLLGITDGIPMCLWALQELTLAGLLSVVLWRVE